MKYESRITFTLFQSLVFLTAGAFITRSRSVLPTIKKAPAIIVPAPELVVNSRTRPPFDKAHPVAQHFASRPVDLTDDQFFLDKFSRSPQYDAVIAGDSRAMVGISPGEMRNKLGGRRIFNFGFRGACLSSDYLDALAALLDPTSRIKTIILGISPLSLTNANETSNGFEKVKQLRPADRFQIREMGKEMENFRPILDPELAGMVFIYHDDGWVTTDRKPNRHILNDLRGRYRNSVLSPRIVDDLMAHVRDWKSKGITTYAFRLPTAPEVDRLEAETVGFNQEQFAKEFEASGGRWLTPDTTGIAWNDLHHMVKNSALIFSDRVAGAIAAQETAERIEVGNVRNQGPGREAGIRPISGSGARALRPEGG